MTNDLFFLQGKLREQHHDPHDRAAALHPHREERSLPPL